MKKKAEVKMSNMERVGEWVRDGDKVGRIIAVSGDDVAIEWEDLRVTQHKFHKMWHLKPFRRL